MAFAHLYFLPVALFVRCLAACVVDCEPGAAAAGEAGLHVFHALAHQEGNRFADGAETKLLPRFLESRFLVIRQFDFV